MSANAGTLFQTADMLHAAPSRNEELEALVRKQFDEICEKDALIESMRAAGSTARPERPSPDSLKDSERLMFLARIGDLTLLNQTLEIELRQALLAHQEEVALERAHDRRRITALEVRALQPMEVDHSVVLEGLLVSNGGTMPAQEARQRMHISKQTLSNLLKLLPKIESRPMKTDKRRRLLVLKS
jgi:hypothetical protein